MKTIATVARILQLVNSTNITSSFSMGPSATSSPAPSLSVTSFVSYTPMQTFNMSGYYSASPMPSYMSLSYSASASASASISATPSMSPSSRATPKITTPQSVSPFSVLSTEQWACILVPCISFAVITWWCNIKLWSRVEHLDHQLKLYQSLKIQNNPMNHNSVRNIIPGLINPSENKAAFSHV